MKTKITLFIMLLALIGWSKQAEAQTPNWAWATDTVGGKSDIVTDASGNIYVAGDLDQYFLIKYDKNGAQSWARTATGTKGPGSGQDYKNTVALDVLGNIVVTGYFNSSTLTLGSTVLTKKGSYDMFVVKYDHNGTLLWAKNVAIGNVGNVGFTVATDASQNIIIVGSYMSSTLVFATATLTNPCTAGGGCPSMIVFKYDKNGNELWAKSSFAGVGTSYCYSVATDATDNIYVGGDFDSKGTNGRNGIVKYNSNGDTLWTQNSGGWFVTTDKSGNIYSAHGGHGTVKDVVVKKYDKNTGAILRTTASTGNTSNEIISLNADTAGNVYVGGTFQSSSITFGTNTLTNAGQNDFFVTKYDNAGNVSWATSIGGTSNDFLTGATIDPAGNVIVVGFFIGPGTLTYGSYTFTDTGIAGIFAKLGNATVVGPTGVSTLASSADFIVYPNPAIGKFHVQYPTANNAVLKIFDMQGSQVYTQTIHNKEELISLDLAAGIYMVQIADGKSLQTKKIVIQE